MQVVNKPYAEQPRGPLAWRLWYSQVRAAGGHISFPARNAALRKLSDATLLELQDISWLKFNEPQRTRLDNEFERRGYFERCDVCNDWVPDGRFQDHNNTHFVLHVVLSHTASDAKRIIMQHSSRFT